MLVVHALKFWPPAPIILHGHLQFQPHTPASPMSRTPTNPGGGSRVRAPSYDRTMSVPPPVLGALDPQAPLPFGRHSVVRAVVAEPVTALLVQRALVMDVAHPSVAAAVAHHSEFQRRPLTRAWATVDAALRLVFGDEQVARDAARQIYAVHDHI